MDPAHVPSVSSLAGALTRRDESVALAAKQRITIARPAPITLVLLAVAFALMVVLGWFMMVLGHDITELVAAVREERATRTQRAQEDVPMGNILLDVDQWRREVSMRPLAAGNLHRTRCLLLAGEKRWDEILSTVQWVRLNSPADLRGETQILEADALRHLHRTVEASQVLHTVDVRPLDSVWRERAAELAGNLWLDAAQSAAPPTQPVQVHGLWWGEGDSAQSAAEPTQPVQAQPEATQTVKPSLSTPEHN